MRRLLIFALLVVAVMATMGAGFRTGSRWGTGMGPGFAAMQRGGAIQVPLIVPDLAFNWLSFDGVDDYLSLSASDLVYGTGPMTLEMWAQVSYDYWRALGQFGGVNAYYFEVFYTELGMRAPYQNKFYTGAPATFSHFVLSYSPPTFAVYVNGTSKGSVPVDNGPYLPTGITPSTEFLVGKSSAIPDEFKGKISRFRLYHRALSAIEVSESFGIASWTTVPEHCDIQVKVGIATNTLIDDASPTRSISVLNGPILGYGKL